MDPSKYFRVKNWCDAKDGLGVWRMARIKKKIKDILIVHYDGWSEKWDTKYCIHSSMVAPFRMHSKGYTGQTSRALRQWEYSQQTLADYSQRVSELINSSFQCNSAYEITVFLRGDLFIQLDCLLSYTYADPAGDIRAVQEFSMSILQLVIKWIQLVPRFYLERQEEENAYWTDLSTAIYNADCEIFEMVVNLLGVNPRTSRFYDKYSIFMSAHSLAMSFLRKGGDTGILSLLKSQIPLSNIWSFIIQTPSIFILAQFRQADFFHEFLTALQKKIQQTKSQHMQFLKISSDSQTNQKFLVQLDKALQGVFPDPEKYGLLDQISHKLRVNFTSVPPIIISSPGHHQTQMFRPPIAPRKDSEHVPKSQMAQLMSLIQQRHSQSMDLILRKLAEAGRRIRSQRSFHNMEQVLKQHKDCDQQQFAVLSCLEYLVSQNQFQQARQLILWRKKILRLAQIGGWPVAAQISNLTRHNFEISEDTLIECTLRQLKEASSEIDESFN